MKYGNYQIELLIQEYQRSIEPLRARVDEILFKPDDLTQADRNELQDLTLTINQHTQMFHHVLQALARSSFNALIENSKVLEASGINWLNRLPTIKDITQTDYYDLFR